MRQAVFKKYCTTRPKHVRNWIEKDKAKIIFLSQTCPMTFAKK